MVSKSLLIVLLGVSFPVISFCEEVRPDKSASVNVSSLFILDENFLIVTDPEPKIGTNWAYFVNNKPVKARDLMQLVGREYCAIASAPTWAAHEDESGVLFLKGNYVRSKKSYGGMVLLARQVGHVLDSAMAIYCAQVSSAMGLGINNATTSDEAIARHLPKFFHPVLK